MTSLEFTRTAAPSFAGIVLALTGAAALRVAHVARAIKHRRDMATLAGFDDRMLSDIGLTRSDLRDAVSTPVWRDPTRILVSRVRERRENRRHASFDLDNEILGAPSIVPASAPARATADVSR